MTFTSLYLGVALIILNAWDAILTLALVGMGHSELNPIMAALITASPYWFLVSKLLIGTGAAIVLGLVGATRALLFVTTIYVAVVGIGAWMLIFGGVGSV